MSKSIIGTTQIRDMLILKKTLEEMGIAFNEINNETLAWGSGYNKFRINVASGEVKYDSMRKTEFEALQKQYSKNFILQEIAKKGHRVESMQVVGDNIEIIAGY